MKITVDIEEVKEGFIGFGLAFQGQGEATALEKAIAFEVTHALDGVINKLLREHGGKVLLANRNLRDS